MTLILLITAVVLISLQITALGCGLSLMLHLSGLSTLSLYTIFIGSAFIFGCIAAFFRAHVQSEKSMIRSKLIHFCLVEGVLTFLILSAIYKMVIYDNSPGLAQHAFWVLIGIAFLEKLFWGVWQKFLWQGRDFFKRVCTPSMRNACANMLIPVIIGAVIYVPDIDRVLALMFIGEQFHHFDFFIMSPGWGIVSGGVPYVDVISQYGLGLPIVLSSLTKFLGSFSYHHAFLVIMWLTIMYFVMMYFFLKSWARSAVISFIAFLLAFRVHMFHYGVSPLIWIYPSATSIRFFFDIVFFMALLKHLRTSKTGYLLLAGVWAGMAIFWMTSTGVFMTATFFFYLIAVFLQKDTRPTIKHGVGLFLAPLVAAGICFYWAAGNHIFQKIFWFNLNEYMDYFVNGRGILPIYDSLKYRWYWSSLMGFVIPLVYLLTFLWVGALWYLRKANLEDFLVVVICLYGLGQYTYYIVRAAQTSYYVVGLPFIWCGCFWLKVFLDSFNRRWQERILVGLMLVSVYALITNHNYLAYPNLFNPSPNPLVDPLVIQRFPDRRGYFNHQVKFIKEQDKLSLNSLGETNEDVLTEDNFRTDPQLKDYYYKEFDFSKDAALIDSFVGPSQKAALLSSFETKILMQANRQPFFYHFPLITSQPMKMRTWPSDAGGTLNFLQETLDQLEQQKPLYVFVEKVFLANSIPASYVENNTSIYSIVQYMRKNYTVVKQGLYLAALKRI